MEALYDGGVCTRCTMATEARDKQRIDEREIRSLSGCRINDSRTFAWQLLLSQSVSAASGVGVDGIFASTENARRWLMPRRSPRR
jgi:hypothetical protein